MNLENQVCSLELAKKLKELRLKQESIWYWIEYKKDNWEIYLKGTESFNYWREKEKLSAFTVAELGEMLPDNLISSGMDEGKWSCIYGLKEDGNDMPDCVWEDKSKYEFGYMTITDKTEANARAKMLIYLIEVGLTEDIKCLQK